MTFFLTIWMYSETCFELEQFLNHFVIPPPPRIFVKLSGPERSRTNSPLDVWGGEERRSHVLGDDQDQGLAGVGRDRAPRQRRREAAE
jgi:hypothetical protein